MPLSAGNNLPEKPRLFRFWKLLAMATRFNYLRLGFLFRFPRPGIERNLLKRSMMRYQAHPDLALPNPLAEMEELPCS
jgi:hypothetical protein